MLNYAKPDIFLPAFNETAQIINVPQTAKAKAESSVFPSLHGHIFNIGLVYNHSPLKTILIVNEQ